MRTTHFALALCLVGIISCDSGGKVNTGSGGSTGGAGTTSAATTTTVASTSSATTSASTTATSGSTTSASSTSTGGLMWPTCNTQPPGSTVATIPAVWAANPAMPTPEWMQGVFVTAVAHGGCAANQSCDIYVQQSESYPNLAAAQKQSIRYAIAPAVSSNFVGIKVGDKVDAYGFASRNTQNGQNELMFLVTPTLAGCMKVVGSGNPLPTAATLDDLTITGYETNGPLFVVLPGISGKPHMPAQTFAMWNTATGPTQPLAEVTDMSPYFLPGDVFTGLTPEMVTHWTTVQGVFGLFVPPATPVVKYEELYIRSMADAAP